MNSMKRRLIFGAIVLVILGLCMVCRNPLPDPEYFYPKEDLEHTRFGRGFRIFDIAWSSKGDVLAAADSNGVVLWDVYSGEQIVAYEVYSQEVTEIAWHPDLKYLATIDNHCSLNVWDFASHSSIIEIPMQNPGDDLENCYHFNLSWAPDGQLIAISFSVDTITSFWIDGRGKVMEFTEQHPLRSEIQWIDDEGFLYLGTDDAIHFWNLTSLEEISKTEMVLDESVTKGWHPAGVWAVSYSLEANKLAYVEFYDHNLGDLVSVLRVVDINSGEEVYHQLDYLVHAIDWSPDGKYLALSYRDGGIGLLDSADFEFLLRIDRHPYPSDREDISIISWSPDGTKVASVGEDGMVTIWHVTDFMNKDEMQ